MPWHHDGLKVVGSLSVMLFPLYFWDYWGVPLAQGSHHHDHADDHGDDHADDHVLADAHGDDEHDYRLPMFYSIVFVVLGGYLAGRFFVVFSRGCLPAVVGMIVLGIFVKDVCGDSMLAALPTLKELAFMVLLTRAGLHIEPDALNALTIALGTLPVTMDALGIALTTMLWKKWSFLEAIVLGVLCAGCGDGLVLPKQREMLDKGFGLTPTLAYVAAPLEVCFSFVVAGIVAGVAGLPALPTWQVVLVFGPASIVVTCVVSVALAWFGAKLAEGRQHFTVGGAPLLLGTMAEELLLLLGAAVILHQIAGAHPVLVPAFRGLPLMQLDLAIIVHGFTYGQLRGHQAAHELDEMLGQAWLFAAPFLFVAIGTSITWSALGNTTYFALPILAVGIACRAATCAALFKATPRTRIAHGHDAREAAAWPLHALYLTIAELGRATVQGALLNSAVDNHWFQSFKNVKIQETAIATIMYMSILGAFLSNVLCEKILKAVPKDPLLGASNRDSYPNRESVAMRERLKTIAHPADDPGRERHMKERRRDPYEHAFESVFAPVARAVARMSHHEKKPSKILRSEAMAEVQREQVAAV